MWKIQLITLYCTVCQLYNSRLAFQVQRLSNNCRPEFTDEELITVYLFGIIKRQFEVKSIYNYTKSHLHDWFPKLPSYQAFDRRLGEMAPALEMLAALLIDSHLLESPPAPTYIIDSMPIMVAKGPRSPHAKVANPLYSLSYCASKKQWYYGLKLHVLGNKREGRLPFPVGAYATTAREHDLLAAKELIDILDPKHCRILADKAYCDAEFERTLLSERDIVISTPRKLKRGEVDVFPGKDVHSSFMSSIRQPIESFFNWLITTTGIQVASKVRSLKGLLVHVFGRLAAALLCLSFEFNY